MSRQVPGNDVNHVKLIVRLLCLAVVVLPGCKASEPSSHGSLPAVSPAEFEARRSVTDCLNSLSVELNLDGQRVDLRIRYPNERVFIVGSTESEPHRREVFDRVYANAGIDVESGSPVPGLNERFAQALPGHPVAASVIKPNGTLHVRTDDKYMFSMTALNMAPDAAVNALLGILVSDRPLATTYFPALRVRQRMHGHMRDARRFGLDTFFYYVAPIDSVQLDVAAFPLLVTYYTDRVELQEVGRTEAAGLRVTLEEGTNGLPPALKSIDGATLLPGQPRKLAFLYSQFIPFNADIDARVHAESMPDRSVPHSHLIGGLDLFGMFGPPATALPGSELYRDATRRSAILDHIIHLQGATFPEGDDRFPPWAEDDFYRRYPHRRP